MRQVDGTKPIQKDAYEISYMQVIPLLQNFTGQK